MAGALFAGMGWYVLFVWERGGVAMFVHYLLAEDTGEFEIVMHSRPIMLIMFNNESVWMFPDTVTADD